VRSVGDTRGAFIPCDHSCHHADQGRGRDCCPLLIPARCSTHATCEGLPPLVATSPFGRRRLHRTGGGCKKLHGPLIRTPRMPRGPAGLHLCAIVRNRPAAKQQDSFCCLLFNLPDRLSALPSADQIDLPLVEPGPMLCTRPGYFQTISTLQHISVLPRCGHNTGASVASPQWSEARSMSSDVTNKCAPQIVAIIGH